MLLAIENARMSLPRYWWAISGMNALGFSAFLFPLFQGRVSTRYLLAAVILAMCIGLVAGIYLTFRSKFDSRDCLWGTIYGITMIGVLLTGGGCAAAVVIAGRDDLRWLAFLTNALVVLISLLGGMWRESRSLEFPDFNSNGRWRARLEIYIDYSKHQVSPSLTKSAGSAGQGNAHEFAMLLVVFGGANIPLLFEIYGGGRVNAVFLAAPLATAVLVYANVKIVGPALVRLLLLRKIEKTRGCRFINADLEQFEELRRNFFFSRWLMMNYKARATDIGSQNPTRTTVKRRRKQR